jgi:two-component system, chemotaxis family, protein-glutamate methylesterase/glutaminase
LPANDVADEVRTPVERGIPPGDDGLGPGNLSRADAADVRLEAVGDGQAVVPIGSFKRIPFDIVAMAASAGGLNALREILSALPEDFPRPIVVVQHLDARHRSLMADILSRRTSLRVKEAADGDRLEPRTVYVAPPDYHLLVNHDGTLSLSHSELVHFVRPSADLLFESVAASFRDRAIAVVLTGTGTDGSMGVQAIKKMGGTVIAQNKDTAEFFGMPGAAIKTKTVDFILPLQDIPGALITLMKGENE